MTPRKFSIIYRSNVITENSRDFVLGMVVTPVHRDVFLYRSLLALEPELEFDIGSTFGNLELISCDSVSSTCEPAAFFLFEISHVESAQIGLYNAERFGTTYTKSKSAFIDLHKYMISHLEMCCAANRSLLDPILPYAMTNCHDSPCHPNEIFSCMGAFSRFCWSNSPPIWVSNGNLSPRYKELTFFITH